MLLSGCALTDPVAQLEAAADKALAVAQSAQNAAQAPVQQAYQTKATAETACKEQIKPMRGRKVQRLHQTRRDRR